MSTTSTPAPSSKHLRLGAVFLFSGIAMGTMILLDSLESLPWPMPPVWYSQRPLWGMFALALFGIGWKLQRAPLLPAGWKPDSPGRRFSRVVVYSRRECHLCDDAKAVLHNYIDFLPPIDEIDIDSDPELQQQLGTSIPVVEIDGVIRFRGRVDENLLRRMIDAHSPHRSCPSDDTTGRCSSL